MSKFDRALDDAFEDLQAKLARVPNSDEVGYLREKLFQDWMLAQRFDDLIDYIHDYYELDGGFADCCILSEALRKQNDLARIERLFEGLLRTRKSAFWRVWPKAQEGHIGAMRESAKYMSLAMEAYAGLWHGYWSLQNEAGQHKVREEMLQFQARVAPPKKAGRSR